MIPMNMQFIAMFHAWSPTLNEHIEISIRVSKGSTCVLQSPSVRSLRICRTRYLQVSGESIVPNNREEDIGTWKIDSLYRKTPMDVTEVQIASCSVNGEVENSWKGSDRLKM
jgi:hypothetical protein